MSLLINFTQDLSRPVEAKSNKTGLDGGGRRRDPATVTGAQPWIAEPFWVAFIALSLPKDHPGPPYQDLTPRDLVIQMGQDMAVCTFHLDYPHMLCRRIVVLALREARWKIIHIHASNVDDSA